MEKTQLQRNSVMEINVHCEESKTTEEVGNKTLQNENITFFNFTQLKYKNFLFLK